MALVRDSWRLAWSGGRPLAVRAQALAFVLLAAVALGSLGTLGAVGVGRLLSPATPPPTRGSGPIGHAESLDDAESEPVGQPDAERHPDAHAESVPDAGDR